MRWLLLLSATVVLGCAEGGGSKPSNDDDGGSGGGGAASDGGAGGTGGKGGSGASVGGASTGEIWINEIHYDNAGLDTAEGIEVAGQAGLDLSPYAIELYSGDNGELYNTLELNGTLADQLNGFGTAWLALPANGLQNGDMDGVALVSTATNELILFLSYEGTLTAVNGIASGATSTDIGVAESEATPEGQSLQLTGFGSDYANFTWGGPETATPNAANVGQGFQ